MKHIIVFAVIISFISLTDAFAQEKKISENEVPAPVLSAFHKSYPKAEIKGTNIEIERGKKCYEIESLDGSVNRDILYTSTGKLIEIEETIPASGLPNGAAKSIEGKFPGGNIEKIEKTTSGTAIIYELIVDSKTQKYEVTLNNDGKIIKSAKLKDKNGN